MMTWLPIVFVASVAGPVVVVVVPDIAVAAVVLNLDVPYYYCHS